MHDFFYLYYLHFHLVLIASEKLCWLNKLLFKWRRIDGAIADTMQASAQSRKGKFGSPMDNPFAYY